MKLSSIDLRFRDRSDVTHALDNLAEDIDIDVVAAIVLSSPQSRLPELG